MPSFIIKVAYNGVIRKIGITDGTFPSFTRLSDKIRTVFCIPKEQVVTAEKVLYSPDGNGTILLAHKVANDAEFKAALSSWGLYGKPLPAKGNMRMTIVTKPVHKPKSEPSAPVPAAATRPVAPVKTESTKKVLVQYDSESEDDGVLPTLMPVQSGKQGKKPVALESDDSSDDGMPSLLKQSINKKDGKVKARSAPTSANPKTFGVGEGMPELVPVSAPPAAVQKGWTQREQETLAKLFATTSKARETANRPVIILSSDSEDEGMPQLRAPKGPVKSAAPQALMGTFGGPEPTYQASAAPSSVSQTLQSTLQSSLKTLETLRRLSPPSSTIPLASTSASASAPHVHSASCGHGPKPAAATSTAVTREDLASALASTKEDIKGILSTFLASYAGKMADTFAADAEDVRKHDENVVPGGFRTTVSPAGGAQQQDRAGSIENKELEDWFDGQGTQIQVWCDGCGLKVGGLRFKCVDCNNYDLCSTCVPALSTTSMHSTQHRFKPIPHPLLAAHLDHTFRGASEPVSTSHSAFVAPIVAAATSVASAVVRHHAYCDFCSTNIEGDRYKCLCCPDFDACAACYDITPEQHPSHSFVRIRNAADLMRSADGPRPVVHRGIVCDGCDKDVIGIRYKCVHPDCADYDLCESCEAAPIERHPKVHPMLKLRVPLHIDAQVWFDDDDSRVTRRNPTGAQLQDQLERTTPSSFSYGTPVAPSPVATPVPSVAPVETPAVATFAFSPIPSAQSPSFVADLVQPVGQFDKVLADLIPATWDVDALCKGVDEILKGGSLGERVPKYDEVVKAKAEEPAARTGLHARFDADITVNDAASFPAGALFVKTWRLQNNGTIAFSPSTALKFSSGEKLQAQASQVVVGAVQPGETFEVSVEMKAPETAGRYVSFWRLVNETGDSFGDRVWTDIIVVDPSVRGPSPGTSSISSSSIIMPAAPSVAPAASIPATDSSAESAAGTLSTTSHDDSGSDIESVADGSEMSAFGEIESHEHEHEGFGSEQDEEDEEEFVVVQDETK